MPSRKISPQAAAATEPASYNRSATDLLLKAFTPRTADNARRVARLLAEGADPWAVDKNGKSVLELCLRDGRRVAIDAWEEAAVPNSFADLPQTLGTQALMLTARVGRLNIVDRQFYLLRFLQKGADPGTGKEAESFIRQVLSAGDSPDFLPGRGWRIIELALKARPQLALTRVYDSTGQQTTLCDVLLSRAPMEVVTDYVGASGHKVDLDWTANPALLGRLHTILNKRWFDDWKDAGLQLGRKDGAGDTLLHHYLRTPFTAPRDPQGLINLLEAGLRMDVTNEAGELPAAMALDTMWLPHPQLDNLLNEAKEVVQRRQDWKVAIHEEGRTKPRRPAAR